nr:hypothetical protein OG999_48425 [Streptomyces sp. NBC_00886]
MKKNNHPVEGPDGLVCTARLPLSSATLNWLADLIRDHCKKIRSRWRALPAVKIATNVLAVLRCDQRPGDLAGGNGIHRTTVTRWVREVVGLLTARAPRLGVPVLGGLPAGHGLHPPTIPLGTPATINTSEGTLAVQPAVA